MSDLDTPTDSNNDGSILSSDVVYFSDNMDPKNAGKPLLRKQSSRLGGLKDTILIPLRYIDNKLPPGSLKGSIFTLINATCGSSILPIPYAMQQGGMGLGLVELVFGCWLNYYTTYLLVSSANNAKLYTFSELARRTYGKYFEFFVKFMIFMNCWGSCVFNTIVLTQLITKAITIFYGDGVPEYLVDPQGIFWPLLYTTAIIFPISLFRNLNALRWVSLVALASTFFISFAVTVESLNPNVCEFSSNFSQLVWWNFDGLIPSFAAVVFAYMCHPNVLDIYFELNRGTKQRMSRVLRTTMILVGVSFFGLGFFGYITFANDQTQLSNGNILYANYNDNPVITTAVIALGLSCLFYMPTQLKPSKDMLRDMIFPPKIPEIDGSVVVTDSVVVKDSVVVNDSVVAPSNGSLVRVPKESNLVHFILVFAVTVSQMLAAIYFNSLPLVLNFIGGINSPLICFVFPTMFYLRLDKTPLFSVKKIVCWSVLISMSIFTLAATIQVISSY
jgi:amino acid permease